MSDLLQLLIDEDFGYEHEGRVWGRASQHNSLVVKEDEQQWFWNSKGMKGGVREYLILVRGMKPAVAEEFLKERLKIVSGYTVEPPREYTPYEKLVDHMWIEGRDIRKYWYDRTLTDETIDRYRLGHHDGWFTIPLYLDGNFVNFQCRRDEPKKSIKLWYDRTTFKPVLFNSEILNFTSEVFITEGLVDAILLSQHGIPAVSKSTGNAHWDNSWYGLFSNIRRVYYIEDNDSAGRFASRLVANSLGADRVKIYSFVDKKSHYDTGDFFKDGGNRDDFLNLVRTNSRRLYELEDNNAFRKKSGFRVGFGRSAV